MKPWLIWLAAMPLAACEPGSEPIRTNPKPEAATTGARVSGEARVGVSVSRAGTDAIGVDMRWYGPGLPDPGR